MIASASIGVPFIPGPDELRPFAAELWLIVGIISNLLIPFAVRRPNIVCAMLSLGVLLIGCISLLIVGTGADVAGEHFRGFLVFDPVAYFWKLTLLGFVAGVVVMWIGHGGQSMREGDAPAFFTLLLGATLGMCLMASTSNLLMIFMAIAMASLPSYMLAGFRKGNHRASEAALKYVLFGAVTAAVLAYGLSFLYGILGTLQLGELASRSNQSLAISVAMLAIVVGVGFKIAAVPLHWWCPDVFEGASIEVTAFLSVASKGAALVLLLRILQTTGSTSGVAWLIGIMGAVTATVGNTAAFTQTSMRRLLAYSSIAQSGYMMCAVALMTSIPNRAGIDPASATGAVLLYLLVYAVMNLGAFAVLASVMRQTGSDSIERFRGLGRSSPVLAGSMLCCLISLIGLPPFAGFGAKVIVLWALAQSGGFGLTLVAIIVANTVLSAFYYFRIVRTMYFDTAEPIKPARDAIGTIVAFGCAAVLVIGFFFFGPLYAMATRNQRMDRIVPVVTADESMTSMGRE